MTNFPTLSYAATKKSITFHIPENRKRFSRYPYQKEPAHIHHHNYGGVPTGIISRIKFYQQQNVVLLIILHSPSTPSLDEDQGGKRFIVAINSKLITLRKTNNYTVSKAILHIQEYFLTLMLNLRLELQ